MMELSRILGWDLVQVRPFLQVGTGTVHQEVAILVYQYFISENQSIGLQMLGYFFEDPRANQVIIVYKRHVWRTPQVERPVPPNSYAALYPLSHEEIDRLILQ
jgi:hypothetical protein